MTISGFYSFFKDYNYVIITSILKNYTKSNSVEIVIILCFMCI
jgi:hypothetical protein